jgi:EmrB/QacA subfamily drug resistance transporter
MGSAVNLALPAIAADFSLSAVGTAWVTGSYLLAAAAFLLPGGRFADLHGRKRVFAAGIAILTAATAACAAAPSGPALLVLRFLQGAGAALVFATAIAMVTSAFPPGERGRALGITVSTVYLGLSLGPFAGGIITSALGWRGIFAVSVLPGILVLAVTGRIRGDRAEAEGERFEPAGSLLYGTALGCLMAGTTVLPRPAAALLLFAGAVLLAIFVRLESSRPSPLLDLRLFRDNAVFAMSCLAALINYSATFAVGFLMSLWLQVARGMDPGRAGLLLAVQPAVMAAFSPLAGRLSDRVEPRLVATTGMGLTTAGLVLLALTPSAAPLGWTVAFLAVMGAGFALFSSPNANAVMSSVEKRQYGVASSTLATMRLLGQMASMAVATLLFALLLGGRTFAEDPPRLVGALHAALWVFAALCLPGVFAMMRASLTETAAVDRIARDADPTSDTPDEGGDE